MARQHSVRGMQASVKRGAVASAYAEKPAEKHTLRTLLIISCSLFFSTTLLYWLMAQIFPGMFLPSGDEPHYLVVSQTLLKYHSLDVMRDYLHRDYLAFYTLPLSPHVAQNIHGHTLPLHSIGAPLLWLIPFWLLGRLGAMLFMTAISVLIVMNIYQLLLTLSFSKRTAFQVSLVYAMASPLYIYAHLTFIEPIGALLCIYVVRLCFQHEIKPLSLVLASLFLGVAPWVHSRFALLEALLFCALLYRLYTLYGLRRWRLFLAYIVPVALLFILLEVYSYTIWGTLNPAANQINSGSLPFEVAPWSGLIGILFDQEHGILIAFPFFMLLGAGIIFMLKKQFLAYNLLVAGLSTFYIVLFTSFRHWSGGWCPPARFMLVLLPLYAPYLARALDLIPPWLARLVFRISLGYGLFYALISLLPPHNGFNAELGTSNTLAFLNLTGVHLTDYLPTMYKPERWPVLLAWILLYAVITLLFVLSRRPALNKVN